MKRTLLSLIAVLAFSTLTIAQHWVQQGAEISTAQRGFQNFCAVSSQVAWASTYDGSGGGADVQEYTMTVNGGTTWTPGTVPGATGLSFSEIFAIDANTAWALFYKVSGSNPQGVYKTTDGGTTWAHQPTALFTNASSFPDAMYFWDANTGVCFGDPINGDFEIYTTTDGGTTWVAVPGANIPNPASGEYGYTSNIDVIGDNVWFGTNKGHIYHSTDKGHNWTVASPPNMTGKNTLPCFRDANFGFCMKYLSATAADTLLLLDKSTDGGATYAAFTYSGSPFSDDMLFVPGTANTFASTGVNTTTGRFGFSYSFDGGATWTRDGDALVSGIQLTTEAWLNDSTGWVASFTNDVTDGFFKFNGVLAPPVANFIANDSAVVLGGQVVFTNLSTGKPTTNVWTFESGSPGTFTGKTPPPVTYSTPGDFNVTLHVTSGFGNNTLLKTDYIHVGGLGINDISNVSITIFPNPVHGMLNLSSSQTIQNIQLFNMVGQAVIEKRVDSKDFSVNVSDLNNGVYTLKLTINDKPYIKKIVVN